MNEPIKALSLWQPWASLVALGVKTLETRSWSTSYRGPLAIHAGLTTAGWREIDGPGLMEERGQVQAVLAAFGVLSEDGRSWPSPWIDADAIHLGDVLLPLGAIVATCTLVDVVPIVGSAHVATETDEKYVIDNADEGKLYHRRAWGVYQWVDDQRPYGDFTPGHFAWLLADIQPLAEPIPARGRQGLWNWTPS